MTTRTSTPLLLCLLAVFVATEAVAQPEPEFIEERDKLAQTGMQFLSVSVDARAAALADAVTTMSGTSTAMHYNPAGMARMPQSFHASLGQNRWFTGIDYNHASVAYQPGSGSFGTIGFSLVAVDYGDIQQTIRADNEKGFSDIGTYSPTAMAVGIGYARALTDRFAVGGNIKYVEQAAGASPISFGDAGNVVQEDFSVNTVAVDFGVIYQTGFRSLALAMNVRNFSQEVTYAEENFELPLTFQAGLSMDMMDAFSRQSDLHSFRLAVDASHPRSYAEQLKIGGEYLFYDLLALRAGYVFPTDEQGVNLGAGLRHAFSGLQAGFDYAYTEFGVLGNVHRIGLQVGF